MDLTLLSAPVSEYNKPGTGAHFTVRSANSPSYSLTRRPGLRKSRALHLEERGSTQEVRNRERHGIQTGTSGFNREDQSVTGFHTRTVRYNSVTGLCEKRENVYKISTVLNHNDEADKTSTVLGSGTCGFASESRGRTEWRRQNLLSRSRSLDWRGGTESPDQSIRTDVFSTRQRGDVSKQASGFEERWTGNERVRSYIPSVQAYSSVGTSHALLDRSSVGPTLDRFSRGHSLPPRLRSQYTDITTSFGPKGGQSILERIEKLYGSSGETEQALSHQKRSSGGTFPRRYSSGRENFSVSSLHSRALIPLAPQKSESTSIHGTPLSSLASRTRTISGSGQGQWQGQLSTKTVEQESIGAGLVEMGTRSLDRTRSKYTTAAKIQAARDTEEMTASVESGSLLKEMSKASVADPAESGGGAVAGSKEKNTINQGEKKSETDGKKERNTIKIELVREQKQNEKSDGIKEERTRSETDLKRSRIEEDVFESNPQKIRLRTVEKKSFTEKLSALSADNVRNKINQFEALTQRAQGVATGQVLPPRRTFSVPTQLSRACDGVKKSCSAKAIGELKDRWEGRREGDKTEEKVAKTEKKFGFENVLYESKTGIRVQDKKVQRGLNFRSLSVDEAALRSANKERQSTDVAEKEEKMTKSDHKSSEDFSKSSGLKMTMNTPREDAQAQNPVKLYMDETDFSNVQSPEETKKNITITNRPTSLLSNTSAGLLQSPEPSSLQKATVSDTPVSDEDKTPTNTPNSSPFLSPCVQPQNSTPATESENDSVFTQEAETQHQDCAKVAPPLDTSTSGIIPDLVSPDASTVYPKGRKRVLDLDAWVAGLNPQIQWDDDDEDDDDDDSTQRDDDSNYDSDSGESSVTITSNMSQSDHKSFSVSLADLCNFAGMDDESEDDSDEWLSSGRRSASLSSEVSVLSYVSVMPTEELDRLIEDVKSLGDNALQGSEDVQVVVLHKEVGVGLGFSLAGGVDQNKPVTVHKVFHSGVAAQEGSIREGDQVLSINGTALRGYAHWEALRVLRRAKSREMGVVVLKAGGVSAASKWPDLTSPTLPTLTEGVETGECVCVLLEKNNRDLGFSLEGGVGSSLGNKPLTVQKIFQGGPVDKVFPGDELLEIEGLSVVGMRRFEAWTLIRKLPPGPVNVVLRRSPKHTDT